MKAVLKAFWRFMGIGCFPIGCLMVWEMWRGTLDWLGMSLISAIVLTEFGVMSMKALLDVEEWP